MKREPVLVLAVLVLVACNGDDDSADPSTGTSESVSTTVETSSPPSSNAPSTSATTTSTAPSTTPTTVSPSTATLPSNTDWRVVVETLGGRRQELYAAPDVSRIGEVCAADSDCANQLNVQIGDLASKGWHVEGADPFVILEAELEDFDGDTLETSTVVTVVAVIQRPANGGQIVDSNGGVVAAVEAETRTGNNEQGRFFLGRVGPTADEWRIISQDELPEVPA